MAVKNKQAPEHERSLEMLKRFGLSLNEALVYVYLLERGTETGGSKIATGTNLHRQYVYVSISKLIFLGLVETVSHGKQKKYKAAAPSQIEKIAKKRVFEAEDIVRELSTFSTVGHEQDFEVLQGAQQIQQFEMDYVYGCEKEEEEFIVGGHTTGFSNLMGDFLGEYLEEKNKKNIKVYYLGNTDEKEFYKKYIGVSKNQQYRFMKRLPRGVTHMLVRKNTVSFYSFLTPPLLYIIKSKTVAENYKQFFMMLWDMAE